MNSKKKWKVTCDDEVWYFATRAAARVWARSINKHPTNKNIRIFGCYNNVDGIARVDRVD